MLPEAVRLLHLLVSSGKHVYVHCTAGINRATLTTVGYLTFVKVSTLSQYILQSPGLHRSVLASSCLLQQSVCQPTPDGLVGNVGAGHITWSLLQHSVLAVACCMPPF